MIAKLNELTAWAHATILAEGPVLAENPIQNMKPKFTFDKAFDSRWTIVFGSIWGICILATIVYLAKGLVSYASARQRGYAEGVTDSAKEVKTALIALAGLAGLPLIVGAVLTVFGL